MKAIMLSIQPKWCELIASGKKTVEVRKTRPKLETPFKCYIYETQKKINPWCNGRGEVIGEFVCNKIEEIRQREVFNADVLCSTTCLTIKEFLDYIGNATAYLWHISDLVIYNEPKELSEFKHSKEYVLKVFRSLSFTDWGYDGPLVEKIDRPPRSWCYVEEIKE